MYPATISFAMPLFGNGIKTMHCPNLQWMLNISAKLLAFRMHIYDSSHTSLNLTQENWVGQLFNVNINIHLLATIWNTYIIEKEK